MVGDPARTEASTKTIDREIWLWDFGGQADYRLIHQLYMDDSSLAVYVKVVVPPDELFKLIWPD